MTQDTDPALSPIKNIGFVFVLFSDVDKWEWTGSGQIASGGLSSSEMCFQGSWCSGFGSRDTSDGNMGCSGSTHPRRPSANCYVYVHKKKTQERKPPGAWWQKITTKNVMPTGDWTDARSAEGCRFLKTADRKRNKNRFFFFPYTFLRFLNPLKHFFLFISIIFFSSFVILSFLLRHWGWYQYFSI